MKLSRLGTTIVLSVRMKTGAMMYGLLTKSEVKMAEYWPSSFKFTMRSARIEMKFIPLCRRFGHKYETALFSLDVMSG